MICTSHVERSNLTIAYIHSENDATVSWVFKETRQPEVCCRALLRVVQLRQDSRKPEGDPSDGGRNHRSRLDSRGINWSNNLADHYPIARWLEKAAQVCRRFNHRRIAGFAAEELQADEIRTFAGDKKTPSWVFVTIEVWSRLWPSTVTGRRSYWNTHALFRDLSRRMNFGRLPLIVTDGSEFYQKVIRRFFGPACLYGQVLKTRRNDRIIKVEQRALHGAAWRFEDALNNSEDSSTLNTSFIERLNLTIRQSSAYLSRRTLSHARSTERLDGEAR